MKKILIIGGGISGLRIASLLDTSQYDVQLVSKEFGGLLGSSTASAYGGNFIFDYGGHVYGLDTSFEKYIKEMSDTVYHNRNAYYIEHNLESKGNNWVPYPVQDFSHNLIRPLTVEWPYEIQFDLDDTFEDFSYYVFGDDFVNNWFRPFNERVWSAQLSEMDCDWIATRVKVPDKQSNSSWGPNNQFAYCPGQIFINRMVNEALKNGVSLANGTIKNLDLNISGGINYVIDNYTSIANSADIIINTAPIAEMFSDTFSYHNKKMIKSNEVELYRYFVTTQQPPGNTSWRL